MLGESLRRRQPRRRAPRSGRGLGLRFWIVGVIAALVIPFAVGYLVAAFALFPQAGAQEGSGIPVPALRGLSTLEAERTLAQAGLGRISVMELPDPGMPEGQIVAQSPLAGQQLRPGVDVRVAVSSGAPRAAVPDVLGDHAERAEQTLRRAGFEVVREDVESPLAAGRVFAVAPGIGTEVRLPTVVTIRVSLGPPAVDTADSALPDTVPPPR